MKRTILSAILVLACGTAFSQARMSLQTRMMLSGSTMPQTAEAQQQYIPAYIHLAPGADLQAIEACGARINLRAGNIVTAQVPLQAFAALQQTEGVEYVQAAVPVRPMLDKVREATGADKVHSGLELSSPYMGKGVVVGIIDAGFDYTHPAFFDWDRNELRIKRVWEQNLDGGTPPEGFTYGGELKTADEILAAEGDISGNSHGTHVAGIAAGSDTINNPYYGIAPEAEIVLVSMGQSTENNVNLTDAIAYIFDYAGEQGKPCVINMSLGTQAGPHDGTSTFDVLADQMQGEGRLIIGSAGNFGGHNFHTSRTFASADDSPLRTFVEFKQTLSTTTMGGDLEIWGDNGTEYKAQIYTYNTFKKEKVDSADIDMTSQEVQEFELKGTIGSVLASAETSPLNGKQHVLVTSQLSGLRSQYQLGIEIAPVKPGKVHVWADDTYLALTSGGVEGFTDGDDELSLAEIGGTGKEIISVGAYVTRNEYKKQGDDMTHKLDEELNGIASFSSKGPAADGRIKPDITAPGCYIVSAVSSHDAISAMDVASYGEWNGSNYYYAYMQGTSMAAPAVAGIVATWLQANPDLSPADIRGVLKKTAVHDEFTGDLPEEGNHIWGLGKIDAWNGIKECIRLASAEGIQAPHAQPFTLRKTGRSTYSLLAAGTEASTASISVYSVSGQRERQFTAEAVPGQETAIDLGGLQQGMYIITVSAEGVQQSFKAVTE